MKNTIRTNAIVFTILIVVGIQGTLFGQEQKQSIESIQLPCVESSYDGKDYYRAMGFGEDSNVSESIFIAREVAINYLLSRAFLEFYEAVEKSLGECVCIDTCRLPDGNYQTIVVYDVPKDSLMHNMERAVKSVQFRIDERRFRESAMKIFEKMELENNKEKRQDKREKQ